MQIPTGDYLIEFLDYRNEVIPNTQATCATLEQAEKRAEATAVLLGTDRYRILRCMQNSIDKKRDRWDPK